MLAPMLTRFARLRSGGLFAAAALLAVSQTGCTLNGLMLAGMLLGGFPSIEPDFDIQTKKSLSDKNVKVAVLCYAPKEVKFDFDDIDKELGRHVAHRLAKKHIQVIDPDAVQGWLDENPDWDRPQQLGAYLEVDYVIQVEVAAYSLYEEGSSNLFRGQADCLVSVYEMEGDDGHVIYTKELQSRYPKHGPVGTTEVSYYDFKRMYMSELSEDIGWLFYEHFSEDEIPKGALGGM